MGVGVWCRQQTKRERQRGNASEQTSARLSVLICSCVMFFRYGSCCRHTSPRDERRRRTTATCTEEAVPHTMLLRRGQSFVQSRVLLYILLCRSRVLQPQQWRCAAVSARRRCRVLCAGSATQRKMLWLRRPRAPLATRGRPHAFETLGRTATHCEHSPIRTRRRRHLPINSLVLCPNKRLDNPTAGRRDHVRAVDRSLLPEL